MAGLESIAERVVDLPKLRDWAQYIETELGQRGFLELLDHVVLEVYELGRRDGQRTLAIRVFRVYGHGEG